MINKTAALFVTVSLIVVSGWAAQRNAPKEIRSKLFKQVLADNSDVRECIAEDEGAARTAEENMTVETVDLNRDGIPEYEVELSGPCSCGMVNCSIFLYRQSAAGYQSILEGAAGFGLKLLKTLSNGYADVKVDARESAATTSSTTYRFDGQQYREARSTLTRVDTGETKLATRRVQFKRGMSATTIQGKVSLLLPDTLIVGARAGQEIKIQLTAPRKSISFMLMDAKTTNSLADNTRSWTGTLPGTGDYIIHVEGDSDRSSPYTMTITIK